MEAILHGLIAVTIYAIGVLMGVWIGRSKPTQKTDDNWRGAIPKSRKAPPKPLHPHK